MILLHRWLQNKNAPMDLWPRSIYLKQSKKKNDTIYLSLFFSAQRLFLLRNFGLWFVWLLGLLYLFLHLQLFGEAGDQLRLQAFGAQRTTIELFAQVIYLRGWGGATTQMYSFSWHIKPVLCAGSALSLNLTFIDFGSSLAQCVGVLTSFVSPSSFSSSSWTGNH